MSVRCQDEYSLPYEKIDKILDTAENKICKQRTNLINTPSKEKKSFNLWEKK